LKPYPKCELFPRHTDCRNCYQFSWTVARVSHRAPTFVYNPVIVTQSVDLFVCDSYLFIYYYLFCDYFKIVAVSILILAWPSPTGSKL